MLGQHAPVALQLSDDPLVNDDVISAAADTAAEVHLHVAARDLLIPAASVSASALFPALVHDPFYVVTQWLIGSSSVSSALSRRFPQHTRALAQHRPPSQEVAVTVATDRRPA